MRQISYALISLQSEDTFARSSAVPSSILRFFYYRFKEVKFNSLKMEQVRYFMQY